MTGPEGRVADGTLKEKLGVGAGLDVGAGACDVPAVLAGWKKLVLGAGTSLTGTVVGVDAEDCDIYEVDVAMDESGVGVGVGSGVGANVTFFPKRLS